jgi:hypothetical protein
MDTEPEAQRSGCFGCLSFLGLMALTGAVMGAIVGLGVGIIALPLVLWP